MDASLYNNLTKVNDSTVVIEFRDAAGGPYPARLYAATGICSQAKDSLTITVYPGARLPRSATLCMTPVVLHPGYWFDSYQWQDGSTDSVYTITQPGTYTLTLETYCGDRLTDTIEVYKNKIGGLGSATVCENDTVMLKAPGGFMNYGWGPAYDLVPVNDTAVEVYPQKDTFYVLTSATPDGCVLKDTIPVAVHSAPVVRLGNDTVICQQDQMVLNAGAGYLSYLWSTGAVTPNITAGPPGTYSVTVTDNNGCRGSDSINIEGKYCADMLVVPSAFSPDGNGINDLFKPHIEGRLDQYEFTVYNRWGGIVYQTIDPSQGWDGRYDGVLQVGGVYAWMCSYQFSGQGRKMAKGTVVLVR
jgi:gliding motility-associated-like protein